MGERWCVMWISGGGGFQAEGPAKAKIFGGTLECMRNSRSASPSQGWRWEFKRTEAGNESGGGGRRHHLVRLWIICVCWEAITGFWVNSCHELCVLKAALWQLHEDLPMGGKSRCRRWVRRWRRLCPSQWQQRDYELFSFRIYLEGRDDGICWWN